MCYERTRASCDQSSNERLDVRVINHCPPKLSTKKTAARICDQVSVAAILVPLRKTQHKATRHRALLHQWHVNEFRVRKRSKICRPDCHICSSSRIYKHARFIFDPACLDCLITLQGLVKRGCSPRREPLHPYGPRYMSAPFLE